MADQPKNDALPDLELVSIRPTEKIVSISLFGPIGVMARVWRGTTNGGVPCDVLVMGVRADKGYDTAELEKALARLVPEAPLDPPQDQPDVVGHG